MSYDQTLCVNSKNTSISRFLLDFVMRILTPVLVSSYILVSGYILFMNLDRSMKGWGLDKFATSDLIKFGMLNELNRTQFVLVLVVISVLLYFALALRNNDNFNKLSPTPMALLAGLADLLTMGVYLLTIGVIIFCLAFVPILMSVISGVVGMDFVPLIPFVLPWVIIYAASASK